jgi:mRNA-degrading endonuclease toxin of MazEF toxin-antitoxin module
MVIVCPIVGIVGTELPRTVVLGAGEPARGAILCDLITTVPKTELTALVGAISLGNLENVGLHLASVLDLAL